MNPPRAAWEPHPLGLLGSSPPPHPRPGLAHPPPRPPGTLSWSGLLSWKGVLLGPPQAFPRPRLVRFADTWLDCPSATPPCSPGWALWWLPPAHSSSPCGPLPCAFLAGAMASVTPALSQMLWAPRRCSFGSEPASLTRPLVVIGRVLLLLPGGRLRAFSIPGEGSSSY